MRHDLEPGDVIEAVGTVARIVGVDSSREASFHPFATLLNNLCSWIANYRKDTPVHIGRVG